MIAFVATALAGGWELAGLYDASAVPRAAGAAPEAEWTWTAPKGMLGSCGEPKAPDGLGVIEAQAVANGLTPTLAVLLRGPRGAAPLDTRSVRIGVGNTQLAPMVRPDWTSITIDGEGLATHKQLIRTQLAMEACLEHKTGRRWQGGNWRGLREAFLLDEPTKEDPSDRMYYRGQRKPIAALLGPSDACFDAEAEARVQAPGDGERAASLALVPADVWGASLRDCASGEKPGLFVDHPSQMMPLVAGGNATSMQALPPMWRPLRVSIHGTSDEDATLDVELDGKPLRTGLPLFGLTRDPKTNQEKRGLQDVLAMIPARYPSFVNDDWQYTVLLVPNWQIVEAASQLGGRRAPETAADGVGWLLENPDQLTVQVAGDPAVLEAEGEVQLPNLMSKYGSFTGRFLRWGYTVGIYAGRSEVVLPSATAPEWSQTEAAQRSRESSVFIGSAAVLGVLVLFGLRRLPDLWVRVPEERVHYWPGVATPESEEGPAPATPLGDLAAGE